MPLGWKEFLALRYLTTRKKDIFITLVSFFSMAGIAIGVATLITVVSVMNGFDHDLSRRIKGLHSDITAESARGLQVSDYRLRDLRQIPGVADAAPYIAGQVLIRRDQSVQGILLRGIEPRLQDKVTLMRNFITAGAMELAPGTVILGEELARRFDVTVGDDIEIIPPDERKIKPFTVSGIFKSGMYDLDAHIGFVHIDDASDLFQMQGFVTGWRFKSREDSALGAVKENIRQFMKGKAVVRTWHDKNTSLFGALKLEKLVMSIIMTLIVVIACFNILSVLMMAVSAKFKDIGILKATGASSKDIAQIFLLKGSLVGLAGTLLGFLTGLGLCFLIGSTGLIALPEDVYYLDYLPVEISWRDVFLICAGSVFLSIAASFYPAHRAAHLEPARILRYE